MLCMQANPVCRMRGYKKAVLAHLPGLSNLDGERNPTSLGYSSAVQESETVAAEVRNKCTSPDFTFQQPDRWLLPTEFQIPPIPAPTAQSACLSAAVSKALESIKVSTVLLSACSAHPHLDGIAILINWSGNLHRGHACEYYAPESIRAPAGDRIWSGSSA